MADNKPPFFHHFSRLDIFRGLLLSPKKQTGDGFEHHCFLFVSPWGVCLCCCSLSSCPTLFSRKLRSCQSLYLLKTRKQSHIHVHAASPVPSSNANSNPSLTVWEWVMPTSRERPFIHYYFSKFKQYGSADKDVQWDFFEYSGLNNDAHSPRISLLGSICL